MDNDSHTAGNEGLNIAVIGMAGRFPGAADVEAFWENLKAGVESISFFTDEELLAAGVSPELLKQPNYIKAKGFLKDAEWFAADFFGFTAREAKNLDPQHRLFLECVWQVLENAGYDPHHLPASTGLYAGAGLGGYLFANLLSGRDLMGREDIFELLISNDKDYLATRTAYKLNLRGPCVTVQTACSTSLAAIHMACQSLLNYECDMALAGGVAVNVPLKHGYLYQEGMILSPDGHCRSFDAQANGTVFGSGLGVVALRRLEDALADGDCIRAVIKGSAINNDGAAKIGFTAPSIEGQSKVIAAALGMAGIAPETISAVEAHGTGTPLGDPIEIAALTRVFRAGTKESQFCAISSVKSNVGHLEVAAGVAGFIKAVLQLERKQLVPNLHFESPNPQIDFANSPFYVNTRLTDWPSDGQPRRAAVSSFGIGGTNAHVVLEESPAVVSVPANRAWQLLVVSAKTTTALDANTANLATYLHDHPDVNLADVAATLQSGRSSFEHRRIAVCRDVADAAAVFGKTDQRVFTAGSVSEGQSIAFMFPGQGAQYPGMGRELYQTERIFHEQVDLCAGILKSHLDLDLRTLLFPPADVDSTEAARRLTDTAIAQPALFVVEYALAKLLQGWGLQPQAMIGHSIGEWVAACLAGVFSLDDALRLVAARGRLMQSLPAGAMLSVEMTQAELTGLLPASLTVAAHNAPALCVVSGPSEAIAALEQMLDERNVSHRRLNTSHAFHSAMMDSILSTFAGLVRQVTLHPPAIPYVSNVTGTWITAEQATDPQYWATHLRQTVHFAEGVETLLTGSTHTLLEVGPGSVLGTLVRQGVNEVSEHGVLATLPRPTEHGSEVEFLLTSVGRLWLSGTVVDWPALHDGQKRLRIPLPSYAFERQRYWVEPQAQVTNTAQPVSLPVQHPLSKGEHPLLGRRLDMASGQWFENVLSATQPWFIDQHKMFDVPMLPETAMIEWALAALRTAVASPSSSRSAWVLDDIAFQAAMRFPNSGAVATQTWIERKDKACRIHCFGRKAADADSAWIEHATVGSGTTIPMPAPLIIDPLRLQAGMTQVSLAGFYDDARQQGIDYGPAFQVIEQLWRDERQVLARIVVSDAVRDDASYTLHPVMLDACLHSVATIMGEDAGTGIRLPVDIDKLIVRGDLGASVWCRATLQVDSAQNKTWADVEMYTERGELAVEIYGLRFKPVAAALFAEPAEHAPALSFYETSWRLQQDAVPSLSSRQFEAPWLVFCPDLQQAREWQAELHRIGCSALAISAGSGFERLGETEFCIDPHAEQDVARLFSMLGDKYPRIGGLIFNGAVSSESNEHAVDESESATGNGSLFSKRLLARMFPMRRGKIAEESRGVDSIDVVSEAYSLAHSSFLLLQHFLSVYSETKPRLVVVSRGTCVPDQQADEKGPDEQGLIQSVLTGMAKAVLAEYPSIQCVQVDLDPQMDAPLVGTILERVAALDGSGHLALRGERCFEARLQLAEAIAPIDATPVVDTDGTYLITGRWGGVGLAVAAWLIEQGARSLVLTGRTVPADSASIAALEQRAQVTLLPADTADISAMEYVFEHIRSHLPPLRGIVHAAGITDDGLFTQLDWPRFQAVLEPKVRGAWNLHRLAAKQQLDFVVFFSSLTSLLGGAGQANYVVANGFLDALAHHRRAAGLPGLSINWGLWAEVGMAAQRNLVNRSASMGVPGIETHEGTEALGQLLAMPVAQLGVARIDWARFIPSLGRDVANTFLSDMQGSFADSSQLNHSLQHKLSNLTDMTPDTARALILEDLFSRVALALGIGMDSVESRKLQPDFPLLRLNKLGLDSLMAVQLRHGLQVGLGVNVPLQQIMGEGTANDIVETIFQQILLRQLAESPDSGNAGENMETELL